MADRLTPWYGIAQTLKHLSTLLPSREDPTEEAQLYYSRACLAATEERYDVALIFCGKALTVDAGHLPTRLLVAQIYDRGLNDFDAALSGYRKVIVLAGYDSGNPYCAAAREALDQLVNVAAPRGQQAKPRRPKAGDPEISLSSTAQ